ncbi:FMN-binding protein [Brachyspira hyodysenteriae]|uniref:FMN-binding protein n=1 Tax=Brachyspira hyodysenteriae TaxID=159 RepID=UPI002342FC65|nr:FMN-binding protein [Brachyspira hyodysenteriae]
MLYRDQFKGQSTIVSLSVVKGIKPEEAGDAQIAAISGATISSTSVVNAVNSAKDEAVNLFKNQ